MKIQREVAAVHRQEVGAGREAARHALELLVATNACGLKLLYEASYTSSLRPHALVARHALVASGLIHK